LAIEELRKPIGEPCRHLAVASTGHGCTRYATRPTSCVEYMCMWIAAGIGDDRHRPDRLGVLLSPRENRKDIVRGLMAFSIIAHEVRLGAMREPAAQAVMRDAAQRGIITLGFRPPTWTSLRVVIGPEELIKEAALWCRLSGHPDLIGILQPPS
jgi:hypothetical protein